MNTEEEMLSFVVYLITAIAVLAIIAIGIINVKGNEILSLTSSVW